MKIIEKLAWLFNKCWENMLESTTTYVLLFLVIFLNFLTKLIYLLHFFKSISQFKHGLVKVCSIYASLHEFAIKTVDVFGKGWQTDVIYIVSSKGFNRVNHQLGTLIFYVVLFFRNNLLVFILPVLKCIIGFRLNYNVCVK